MTWLAGPDQHAPVWNLVLTMIAASGFRPWLWAFLVLMGLLGTLRN
ncbi:hypothetical protein GA0115242_137014 [Streptomyces sp. SolWspMP-5a-2]|nr:hypothetical protein GA0115242_137014 [Streptomyces sp. SolWspMP-5a-2]